MWAAKFLIIIRQQQRIIEVSISLYHLWSSAAGALILWQDVLPIIPLYPDFILFFAKHSSLDTKREADIFLSALSEL